MEVLSHQGGCTEQERLEWAGERERQNLELACGPRELTCRPHCFSQRNEEQVGGCMSSKVTLVGAGVGTAQESRVKGDAQRWAG